MAPKDVILAAGLIGLDENRPNEESRQYCPFGSLAPHIPF
jgi:hypothetical protein